MYDKDVVIEALTAREFHGFPAPARTGQAMLYCPNCGQVLRSNVVSKYENGLVRDYMNGLAEFKCWKPHPAATPTSKNPPKPELPVEDDYFGAGKNALGIYEVTCLQCTGISHFLLRSSESGMKALALYKRDAGVSTPNTPQPVTYYLNQAYLCSSVGANSAAVVMYRGALEQLLHQQGYDKGTAGQRLGKLLEDRVAGKAPKWIQDLDDRFLTVIKELGDGGIHPNDGTVEKQDALDAEVLRSIEHTFQEILEKVYEAPLKQQKRLDGLKGVASLFKKRAH